MLRNASVEPGELNLRQPVAFLVAIVSIVPALVGLVPSTVALAASSKVVFVEGSCASSGGCMPTSNAAFASYTFSSLAAASVSASTLAAYDTVVLMRPCDFTFTGGQQTAVVDWVANGGKLLVYDSECTPVDYSWLPYPFTTTNPGAQGANGDYFIVEDNTLGSSDPTDTAHYLDRDMIANGTDAVGDSNVVITNDAHWCGHTAALNTQGNYGFDHMYATYGSGFMIWNGLDIDTHSTDTDPNQPTAVGYYAKLWLLELEQKWGPAFGGTGLPCSVLVCASAGTPAAPLTLTRPLAGHIYVDDVDAGASPIGSTLVYGALTVNATSTNYSALRSVSFWVDGVNQGTTAPPAPLTWAFQGDLASRGSHTLEVRSQEKGCGADRVQQKVVTPAYDGFARAVGLFSGATVPASVEVAVPGASAGGDDAADGRLVTREIVPQLQSTTVEAINDTASVSLDASGDRIAHSRSVLTHVSLLGGLVTADTIGADAIVTFDAASRTTSADASGSFIENLRVAGNPVAAPTAPNTRVPIPLGASYLVLDEISSLQYKVPAMLTVSALHLYVETPTERGEVILAQAHARVNLLRGGVPRALYTQDDAGTGGDVPGAAPGFTLTPPVAAVGGSLSPSDNADVYAMLVTQGSKITATLKPAEKAQLFVPQPAVAPAPNPAAILAFVASNTAVTVPTLRLDLIDPVSGEARDSSQLPLSAPQRVELNVDDSGEWLVKVSVPKGLPLSAMVNYTLVVTVTPILLDATQNDAGSGGDAPSTCDPSAPLLTTGLYHGVLRDADNSDTFQVHALGGQDLTAILKPSEDLDGADFDLQLFDGTCTLMSESRLGKPLLGIDGTQMKGAPDAVASLPIQSTGTYYIRIERTNGVGNWYLAVRLDDTIPALPANDAGSGGDAGNDWSTATPVPAPGVVGGTARDGDADWYSFSANPGQRIVVLLAPNPTSQWTFDLVGPRSAGDLRATGGPVASLVGPKEIVYTVPATDAAGSQFRIDVQPNSGGGNYVIGIVVAG